jgi:hypothetical protein
VYIYKLADRIVVMKNGRKKSIHIRALPVLRLVALSYRKPRTTASWRTAIRSNLLLDLTSVVTTAVSVRPSIITDAPPTGEPVEESRTDPLT